MPSRVDIDPTEIWLLVPYIHVSEWYSNPDRVRYRLAGTELVAAISVEISGKWLTDFHTDLLDVRQTMDLYYRVIAARAPVFGRTLESEIRTGVDFFEWILCPLSNDDNTITHFIGLEDYVAKHRYLGAGR